MKRPNARHAKNATRNTRAPALHRPTSAQAFIRIVVCTRPLVSLPTARLRLGVSRDVGALHQKQASTIWKKAKPVPLGMRNSLNFQDQELHANRCGSGKIPAFQIATASNGGLALGPLPG